MSNLSSSADFLIKLSESVGPIGAVFIFVGIIIVIVGGQAFLHYTRRKGLRDLVDREVLKILDKVDETESDVSVILDLMRNLAQAILSINHKIKHTISDKDSISLLKLITNGHLLLNVMSQVILFSSDVEAKPKEILELREQFVLEMINKWNDYIDNLNSFRAPLKIGDFINKEFHLKFFHSQTGLASKIREIVFNLNIVPGAKIGRIKTLFFNFSQETIHTLEEELNRIMNGGE